MIYKTKYREIIPWTIEQKIFYVKAYCETKSFKIVQARYTRKFNFITFLNRTQIFKLVKNFETQGTWEDSGTMGSSPSGPLIIQEECAWVINNSAHYIQQCLQLNGCYLEHVIDGFFWNFYLMFETKWLQILKSYPFTFQ